ncbi:DUF3231 family protein [Pseudogracilibacillus auburnensis]|uniref:Uncharacterized protein DUF3231 n=1 Tax=Pseudogracilibacillus auburnensis TaxID=1494959 RepID=A0A2V3VY46_9BACI|nr:DUF3231 family protein [Pseudogracilibacillus auburnensis]MBO1003477.1 DUF3231 family protein [Pseudogracilibacillus auburnensis]PXW86536.1 uncharacterized protein DUF3231 [Pseudogracilibacillus auburnensis]
MGILSGNPQDEPMHYGEVSATWTYLFAEKGMIATYQTLINHTGDDDLKKLLQEAIQGAKTESEQIEELLKANGIALPPAPPERPVSNLEDIPAGARFADQEIAAMLSMNSAKGLVACSTIMGQSIREDIGLMFGQFHTNKAMFGAKVLKLNKEKGWLVPPPLHLNTPDK